jgi:hypothetical protein
MLGNTLTLTIDGGSVILTKINQDSYASEYLYRDSEEEFTARIRHTKVSKGGVSYDRHNFELRHKVFETTTAAEINRLTYFVVEQLANDMSIILPMGVFSFAVATSGSFLTSLTKWES